MAELESQVNPIFACWMGGYKLLSGRRRTISSPNSIRGEEKPPSPGMPAATRCCYGSCVLRAAQRPTLHVQQVRMLELERTQHKLLLESLQQRHQEDLDLLESAHRYRILTHPPHVTSLPMALSSLCGWDCKKAFQIHPWVGRHKVMLLLTHWGFMDEPK